MGEDFSDLGTSAPPPPPGPTPSLGTNAPPPSTPPSTTVDRLAEAIATIGEQSGSRYDLVGPPSKSGDRPYGRYQVMGANIPEWSEAAGKGRLTPQQFLADPEAQEAVVKHRLGLLLDQHGGNARDVAAVWHSGVPFEQAVREGRQDSLGTKTADYATRVAGAANAKSAESAPLDFSDLGTTEPPQTVTTTTTTSTPEQAAAQKAGGLVPQGRGAPEPDYATDPRFNTQLSPAEEARFQQWKAQYAPRDSGVDYDLRGAFKAGLTPDPISGHWDDTFKKPNHPTFSIFSQYAKLAPEKAGTWKGDTYIPPQPKAPIPPTPGKSMRDTSQKEVERELNTMFGYAPDDWRGRYLAILGKTGVDAISDFFEGAEKITHPGDFWEAFGSLLKILHPIGAPGEATSGLVMQAAADSGFAAAHPYLAKLLALAAGVTIGSKVRIPGLGETPRMPLKGTATTRAAAAEAAERAAAAAEKAAAARSASEEAAERGTQWVEAQRTVSTQRAAEAERAAAERAAAEAQERAAAAQATVSPSTEAAERAREALTPAGVTVEQGGQAAQAALEAKLAEVKEPVQGIYTAIEEAAANKAKVLDPAEYQGVYDQIDALESELGPTLTGQAKSILANLKSKIASGERVTLEDMSQYKSQLDTILPGKKPPIGASPKTAALYNFKWKVRDLMSGMLDGNEKEWFDVANAMWRDEVIPLQQLVALVKKSDPMTVVERLFGNGTTDKQAAMARRLMRYLKDDAAGSAEVIRQAFGARLIRQATRRSDGALDPKKLVELYDRMHDVVAENLLNEGQRNFFQALRTEQAAAETAAKTAATAVKTAKAEASATAREGQAAVAEAQQRARSYTRELSKAASTAEKEAKTAQTAAAAARAEAEKPTRLARFMATGLRIGTIGAAGKIAGVAHTTAGAAAEGIVGSFILPTDRLAEALANSQTANLLARALRTPTNSAVAPTLYYELKRRLGESAAEEQAEE